jgi:pimeloyl-ACP methyl ester carboxylesterase
MTTPAPAYRGGIPPTVLLVHGAFADASSWAGVVPELLAAGIDVLAPANPLRELTTDAAYIAGVAAEIDGPVLLAGHSYGGAVITVAGAQATNVVGLVYIAAYAVDEGESAVDINGRFPQTRLGLALRPVTFTNGRGALAVELYIKGDAFQAVFAADLPEPLTTVLAATQRPITAAALEGRPEAVAWRTLPSWYMVATRDQALHPQAQRFMAQRADALTVEVDASHLVMLSQPAAVAELIRTAARAQVQQQGK